MISGGGSPRLRLQELSRAFPWIAVGVVAISIRLIRLDHFSFWLDEILETYTLRGSWAHTWQSLRWEGLQAPLDYSIRKLLEPWEPTDLVRRLPSVLWGALTVPLFGWLLARRGGRPLGLCAAVLLAVAPYHVRYSQEVRPYALGLLLLVVSLLALDGYLEMPRRLRLAALYFAFLATLYTLYLAAIILALVAAGLLTEDCWDRDPARRRGARRFLARSPVFIGALAIGYIPWWPVLFTAVRSPALTVAPGLSLLRFRRYVSYFGFAAHEAAPLRWAGFFFLTALCAGLVAAVRAPRLRFLLVWGVGGVGLIELLEQRHPSYDSIFHWLPAGLGLTALAALGVSRVLQWPWSPAPRWGIAFLFLLLSFQGLAAYIRSGRPDWRPIARFLAATPRSERIFVENQYTQLCLGYYIVGPDWLCCKKATQREIANLDGDLPRLLQAWDRRHDARLVLAAGPRSAALRSWSADFPLTPFPAAEGEAGAQVRLLRSDER